MYLKEKIFAIIFFLLFTHCKSLLAADTSEDYRFTLIGIEQGLSQTTVNTSLQDFEGYMWFGTGNGLNKYDGYKFYVYINDPNDKTTISDDGISSLMEDKNKTLWVGTVGGNLNMYNRSTDGFVYQNISAYLQVIPQQKEDFYEYPLSFSRNQSFTITSIAEDKNGNLWIGTWGKGIVVINKNFKKIKHLFHTDDSLSVLPSNRIRKILCDTNGRIWIATFGSGLCLINEYSDNYTKFDIRTFIHSSDKKYSLSDDKIISLYQDSKKNLWIGTFYGGLNFIPRIDQQDFNSDVQFLHYKNSSNPNSISNNTIMEITEDKNGNLWIGTFGGGLNKLDFDKTIFQHFLADPFESNSLADNDVLSVCIDKSGIVWAGSHLGKGITKIQKNKTKFNLISHIPGNLNSLNDGVVWAIHQDKNFNLWVGTYKGGVNFFDTQKRKFTFYKNGSKERLSSNHVRVIKEDVYGNLWIGTYDGGLNILQKETGKIKVYKNDPANPNSLAGNQVQDIFIENKNTYWIGTFGGGLCKVVTDKNPFYEELKFYRIESDPNNSNSLSDNRVYKIFKDKEGIFWIGTFGGGLNKFNPIDNTFYNYKNIPGNDSSLSENNVMMVTEDSYGMLWIGTYGGGLVSMNKNTGVFRRYSSVNGFTSGVVYGIMEDRLKNLWISSDDGIFRFDLINHDFTRFDIQDGLQSLEFSGGAYLTNNKGEMFFGGIKGVNYFYPDSIEVNNYLPQVVITSIKIFNDNIRGARKELILNHDQNFITFDFASLDFSDPKDNQYAYMLEGLEDEWQLTNAQRRTASYTNLQPGTYTFKVRGSNSDGLWNENYASLSIIINPPFWQTWWFIILSVLIVASLLYYLSTIRIKNLLAIEKLKTKIAADLHDNVGSGLTEISILSEIATRNINSDSKKPEGEIKKISEISRQLVDNMSDIVWVVNPKRDSLHDLVTRLKDSYNETLSSLGIKLIVKNLDRLKEIKLPMDYKQNLFLIMKEAINNSIKHSRCSNLIVDTSVRTNALEITITDDGIGMEEPYYNMGNGIYNMNERAKQIDGKIKIKSSKNEGTQVKFIGKLTKTLTSFSFFNK